MTLYMLKKKGYLFKHVGGVARNIIPYGIENILCIYFWD